MTRLKKLREENNIDQKVLAIDLNVSQPTVSDWESGKKLPSAENMIRLADYFKVSIDYLLYRSDTKNPDYVHSDCWDGCHLYEIRTQRGESQEFVAMSIGISTANYIQYENAKKDPSIDILYKLADHFGVDIDYILGFTWGLCDETGNIYTTDFSVSSKEEQFLIERYRLFPQISVSELTDLLGLFQSLNPLGRKAALSSLQGISNTPDFLMQSPQRKNLA